MKLTNRMLYYTLQPYIVSHNLNIHAACSYCTVQYITNIQNLTDCPGNRIFILDDQLDFHQLTTDFFTYRHDCGSLFILPNADKNIPELPCPFLACEIPSDKIYTRILELSETCEQILETMQELCRSMGNESKIINYLSDIFDNSVMLVDSTLNIVAKSQTRSTQKEDSCWAQIEEAKKIPVDMTMHLLSQSPPSSTRRKDGAFLEENIYPHRCICLNLFRNKLYNGRLLVIGNNMPLHENVIDLLNMLSPLLSVYMDERNSKLNHTLSIQDYFWSEVLAGNITDHRLIQEQLSCLHWSSSDHYILALISMKNIEKEQMYAQHLRSCLRNTRYETVIFHYEQNIVALFRLVHISRQEILDFLTETLEKYKVQVGISNVFSNLFSIAAFYPQAKQALEIGSRSPHRPELYFYQDVVLDHFASRALEHENPITFIHPVVLEMYTMDMQKHTDYCLTLKIYLEEERSITRTARRMHIHKNTLTYRLDKMEQIFELNLDHFDERIWMLISLQMLTKNINIKQKELP